MAQYQGVFPTPQVPAGARADFESPNLTSAERETGLTTAESQQQLDTSTPEVQSPGSKKPSLMSKIKDKTQKLKTKVKKELHSRTSDKDTTTDPSAGQRDGASTTSSEDESHQTPAGSEVPYSQLSKQPGDPVAADRDFSTTSAPPAIEMSEDARAPPVHGGDAYERAVYGLKGSSTENMFTSGRELGTEEDLEAVAETRRSKDGSPDFISPYRTPGPADTLQAVPTQYFYKEPRAAPPTEEDSRHGKSDVPSAAGLASAGEAPVVAGWGGNDGLPSATSRDYHSGVIDDSITHGPFPTDQQEFKGNTAAERDDLPFTERLREAALAAGSAETAKHHLEDEAHTGEDKPYIERATEGLAGAKDRVAGAVLPGLETTRTGQENDYYEDKLVTERAGDNLTSAKDTVVGAAYDTTGESTSSEQKPLTERATDGLYKAKETVLGATYAAKDKITGETTDSSAYGEKPKPYTEQAKEGLYGAKDNAVETGQTAKDYVVGSTDSSGYGEQQKPIIERAKEGFYDAKDRVTGAVTGFTSPETVTKEEKPYTQRAEEGLRGSGSGETGSEYVPQEERPLTQRLTETVVDAKDSVVGSADESENQTVEATDTGNYGDQKPYSERVTESLGNAKDWMVDSAYNAKDSVVGATETDTEGAQGTSLTDRFSALVGAVGSKVGYYPAEETGLQGSPVSSSPGAERKSWGEWIADSLNPSKQGVTSKSGSVEIGEVDTVSATDAGKSWTDKTNDTLSGVAGTVGSKLGYGSGTQESNVPPSSESQETVVSAEQKPLTQRVQESAISAKDVIASKLGYASTQAPADTERAVDETVNDGLDQAKNSATVTKEAAAARFYPDEHDKALSEKITSTLGGLSLGGSSPRGSAATDEPNSGIFGRVSEGVSSLLWKKPAASDEVQDVPAKHLAEGTQQVGQAFQQAGRNMEENLEANAEA